MAKVKDSFVTLSKALHLMLPYPPFTLSDRHNSGAMQVCLLLALAMHHVADESHTTKRFFPHKSNVDLIRVYKYLLIPVKVK